MIGIFDEVFNGAGRSEMYRSWLVPDLFPHERPPRLENWSLEDLEAYCGIRGARGGPGGEGDCSSRSRRMERG